MKQILLASAIIMIGFSSCKKCYTCTIVETDVNGQEIGTKKQKYCLEKGQDDVLKNQSNCKSTI